MTYFAEIERYFIEKRGRGLMLSPKDWQVMLEWQERDIPLRVVLRGIDKAFLSKGSLRQEVNFLAYCKSQVDKGWREYQKQMRGKAESPVSQQAAFSQSILQRLSALKGELEAKLEQAGPLLGVLQKGCRTLGGLISLLQEDDSATLDQLEPKLNAIHQEMLIGLKTNMPQSELKQIENAVEAELKAYRRWMRDEAYRATYGELVDERVLRHYGLCQLRLCDL